MLKIAEPPNPPCGRVSGLTVTIPPDIQEFVPLLDDELEDEEEDDDVIPPEEELDEELLEDELEQGSVK